MTLLSPPPSLSPEESGEHFLEASFGFFIYIFINNSIHACKYKCQCKYLGPGGRKVSGGVFTLVLFSRSVFSFFPLPDMWPQISELNFYPDPTEPESRSMYICFSHCSDTFGLSFERILSDKKKKWRRYTSQTIPWAHVYLCHYK